MQSYIVIIHHSTIKVTLKIYMCIYQSEIFFQLSFLKYGGCLWVRIMLKCFIMLIYHINIKALNDNLRMLICFQSWINSFQLTNYVSFFILNLLYCIKDIQIFFGKNMKEGHTVSPCLYKMLGQLLFHLTKSPWD